MAMLKEKHNKCYAQFSSEQGVAALEASVSIFIIMFLVSFVYEFLKYQHDIAAIFFSENIAANRVDLTALDNKPTSIPDNFLLQLNNSVSGPFNGVVFSKVKMVCENKYFREVSCNKESRVIKLNYSVRRTYTNPVINRLFSLPITFNREVYLVNDYYY